MRAAGPALAALALAGSAAVYGAEECGATAAGECAAGEWFPTVPKVVYEGPSSTSPLAYRYYDPDEELLGRRMEDWLGLSVAYWHTMRGDGSDPFGSATRAWPWDDGTESLENAERRLGAFFELVGKLGLRHWCFHDRDIAPEGATWAETSSNLRRVVATAARLQAAANATVLWGTAQLFKHPRYASGAATSPDPAAFAYAAAQVKAAMDATRELGGKGYVFWGGREGYSTLLNTDMAAEQSHLASLLRMAASYAGEIGFEGPLMIEPKPQEPTKHQYDWDVATTAGFLERHNLTGAGRFLINVECNHATLSGHSCFHELESARLLGLLGNIDANTGDPQVGWDTDEFLTDPREAALAMLSVVRNGGLDVGINFDAKLRRESVDPEDLAIAHVAGVDALARGLRAAVAAVEDGALDAMVKARYAGWEGEGEASAGAAVAAAGASLASLEAWVLEAEARGDQAAAAAGTQSGKQELYERVLSRYI